jgi:hypothetical protein
VLKQLMLENRSEALQDAQLVEVQIRNVSHSTQTLRWDVSRSVHLTLVNGRTVWPLGHKLHGLSGNSLVVRGVLAVDIPPQATYRLYPVFSFARLRAGASLVIDRVGAVRLPG